MEHDHHSMQKKLEHSLGKPMVENPENDVHAGHDMQKMSHMNHEAAMTDPNMAKRQ
mgnify:CR=1 FL=1